MRFLKWSSQATAANGSVARSVAFALASVLIFSACEPILTQDPREHFVDGKLPAGAFRLANQIWDLPSAERILKRVAQDQSDRTLVRVGVMDNGVDIAHPDLVDQVDFRVENGRIAAAGFDIMGGDRIGSPQILRYEYYAFGAEGIEGDKIKGAPADPFKKLADYDRAFLDEFIPKLHADARFKNTIFSKYTKENFSILGAQRFALHELNLKRIEERKRNSNWKPLDLSWTPKADATVDEIQSSLSERYLFIFEPFALSEKGLAAPVGLDKNFIDHLAGPDNLVYDAALGPEFLALVKSEFAAFAQRSGYQKDFDQLMKFMDPRLFEVSDTKEARLEKSMDKLWDALKFARKGYASEDPIRVFEAGVYAAGMKRRLQTLREWPKSRVVPTIDDVKSASADLLREFEGIARHVVENPKKFTREELEYSKDYVKKVKGWAAIYEEYLARKGWKPELLGKPGNMDPKTASIYRKHLVRTKHPLLDPAAVEQSHGSHVSGIIAKQNPKIRIVPIRVVTESTKSSPAKDPELLAEFKKGFESWIDEPLVMRALEGRFGSKFGGKKGPELKAEIMRVFADMIPRNFEENKLDFRFLGEVERAIEVAGREKIKFVNVSLGTTFDRAVIDYRNLDVEKELKAYFEFLKFEYFKWKIGRTAVEKSPKTLFLVATGNDGAWRDGRSRSALPVDLSSPFLADYEDASKGLVAPNNRIKNILGVGSLSQIDEISSFSNLLISKTPMVMAHGEAVLSPIRTISSEATDAIWAKELGMSFGFTLGPLSGDERLKPYLIEKYGLKGTPEEIKVQLEAIQERLASESELFDDIGAGLKTDLYLQHPNMRARMSGTSMATPTLTGLVANEYQKMIVQKGIDERAAYELPEFAPEKLIGRVMEKTEPMFKDSTVINLRKWTGELNWEKSPEELALEAKLKRLRGNDPQFLAGPRTKMIRTNCYGVFRKGKTPPTNASL
jgi:subtilisin family serine protease